MLENPFLHKKELNALSFSCQHRERKKDEILTVLSHHYRFFHLFYLLSSCSFSQQNIAQSHEIIDLSTIFKTRLHTQRNAKIKFELRTYFDTTLYNNHYDKMSDNNTAFLTTLPIELIYRILDHLSSQDILLSVRNVCEQLNAITDVYPPYQVNFFLDFHLFRSKVSFRNQVCFVPSIDESAILFSIGKGI